MGKVHQFPSLGNLTSTTEVPAARRSANEDPADLKFTMADVVVFLQAQGFMLVPRDRYNSDNDAALDGVAIDGPYIAGNAHITAPPNTLVFRAQ